MGDRLNAFLGLGDDDDPGDTADDPADAADGVDDAADGVDARDREAAGGVVDIPDEGGWSGPAVTSGDEDQEELARRRPLSEWLPLRVERAASTESGHVADRVDLIEGSLSSSQAMPPGPTDEVVHGSSTGGFADRAIGDRTGSAPSEPAAAPTAGTFGAGTGEVALVADDGGAMVSGESAVDRTGRDDDLPRDGLDGDRPETSAVLVSVAIESVRANEFQPRTNFDDDELEALATSIAAVGVLQPIIVRRIDDGRYELIAGERRWRAAERAGLLRISALVRETDDQGALEQAVVENLHREDLNAIDEAAAYRQLMEDFGLTQEAVAQRVGKSRSAVANTLRLLQLAPDVLRLVRTRELSAGHARALLAVPDTGLQALLAARVVAEELSVRQIEDLVRAASEGGRQREPEPPSSQGGKEAALLEIERLLGDRLATRVSVSLKRNRGRLVVEFADLEDLDRIYRELTE